MVSEQSAVFLSAGSAILLAGWAWWSGRHGHGNQRATRANQNRPLVKAPISRYAKENGTKKGKPSHAT